LASANYAACLKIILQNEGGYVNNPKDPGGETNYGITKATARSHGYTGNMHDIPMSVVERIYRESYWKGCDDLPSGVDLCVFDFAVNSGPGRAWGVYKAAKSINGICDERLRFLRGLKTWATFGKGWAKRVELVRSKALKMAAAPAAPPVAPPAAPVAPTAPAPAPVAPAKPVAPKAAPAPTATPPVSIWTTIGNLLSAFFAAISKKT
jgi:lysozyme family protein